jgi:hypothetical protein
MCGELLKERNNNTFNFFCPNCHKDSIHDTIDKYINLQHINSVNQYQDAMQDIENANNEFAKLGQNLMEKILTAIKLTMKKYDIIYPLKEDFTEEFFESVLSLFYEDPSLKNIKIVLSDDSTLSPDIFPCISIYYSLRDQDIPLINNFGLKLDDKYNKVMRIIGPIINQLMNNDRNIHYYLTDNKLMIMNALGEKNTIDIKENNILASDLMYVLNKLNQDNHD